MSFPPTFPAGKLVPIYRRICFRPYSANFSQKSGIVISAVAVWLALSERWACDDQRRPLAFANDQAKPIPLLSIWPGNHPLGGDALDPIPAVFSEREGLAARARHRCGAMNSCGSCDNGSGRNLPPRSAKSELNG